MLRACTRLPAFLLAGEEPTARSARVETKFGTKRTLEIDGGDQSTYMTLNRKSLVHSLPHRLRDSLKTCAERSTNNKRLHTERGERRCTRSSSCTRLCGAGRAIVIFTASIVRERSTNNKRLHTERGERRGTRISSPSSFARLYGVLITSVFY